MAVTPKRRKRLQNEHYSSELNEQTVLKCISMTFDYAVFAKVILD